jgi:hypothetical protein
MRAVELESTSETLERYSVPTIDEIETQNTLRLMIECPWKHTTMIYIYISIEAIWYHGKKIYIRGTTCPTIHSTFIYNI